MARYIVVEFADNGDAEAFISAVAGDSKVDGKRRVVGVFVKPIKLCGCADWRHINYGDKNREHEVVRGERFGWWICTRCKRPRRAGHQLVNQIKASETYPERDWHPEYEMTVTGLDVSGIHIDNINRPKKLRKWRKRWLAGS